MIEPMSYLENLPVEVNGHYLRIKARATGKKWCIRYIRKVMAEDHNVEHWKYRTEIQCWGNDLEETAKKMFMKIKNI